MRLLRYEWSKLAHLPALWGVLALCLTFNCLLLGSGDRWRWEWNEAATMTGGLGQLLDGVKKHFSLEHFDTGDILLVLIILFLYLEDGDNLELVITLGLLLLLGLEDEKAQE